MSWGEERRAAGLTGGTVLIAGQEVTGEFFSILPLEATVLDTGATETELAGFGKLSGKTIPAGVSIYGAFTKVKIVSGTVIVYNRN